MAATAAKLYYQEQQQQQQEQQELVVGSSTTTVTTAEAPNEPAAAEVEPAAKAGEWGKWAGKWDGKWDGEGEWEEDDDEWDEDWDRLHDDGPMYASGSGSAKAAALASKFDSMIKLEPMSRGGGGALSQSAGKSMAQAERKVEAAKHQGLTRDERATTDQVLDPRTRMILFKLINSGTIESINGCVSTGKEANVYHAFGPECELAVKVYKTSILIFKDRDRYVSGEFRFRHGYCKSNPRKMVRMWFGPHLGEVRRAPRRAVLV